MTQSPPEFLSLHNAGVSFGEHTVFKDVSFTIEPGEFVGVLGPNGVGKSTLLSAILGQVELSHGSGMFLGGPLGAHKDHIAVVPQQGSAPACSMLRGRDIVELGIDGHKWLPRWTRGNNRDIQQRVSQALEHVDATSLADKPIGSLSGGQMQRLRIAASLAAQAKLLLCDEPLLSLDMASQKAVVESLNYAREMTGASVLFVTHEINPILPHTNKVIYLAKEKAVVGAPEDVFTSDVLTKLFDTPVEVTKIRDRLVVIGDHDNCCSGHGIHSATSADGLVAVS